MRVILDVIEGPLKGRSYLCDREGASIVGRGRHANLPLPEDAALSREHFVLDLQSQECELRDLNSTNGTYVNDVRVERVKLKTGDQIAAGQSLFLVRIEGANHNSSAEVLPMSTGEGQFPVPTGERPPGVRGLAGAALEGTVDAPVMSGASIRCAGCGHEAPPGIGVVSAGSANLQDSITWLCDLCRAEVSTTPQPVPHYRTLREIGRGAMGVVYLAQHYKTGQRVALKLISPETAAARSAIDRFLREMSVISQLKHPNIVEYLEQGTARGQFWFAMEYVEGTSLEVLAEKYKGRYPINQACRMAYQVLKGLEHAHAKGFVHRDIKPENILIGKTDAGLTAKISDFGLAKSFRSIGLSGLTFSGEMRGTIPFMPPEQIVDFKKVLPAADLYSTAATLYYLIAGKYIIDAPEEGGDLIRALLEQDPIPIRLRRREVPLGLEAALMRCLSRDPEARYPNATAVREALRPFC
jgi:serine/threonine-protein kinase